MKTCDDCRSKTHGDFGWYCDFSGGPRTLPCEKFKPKFLLRDSQWHYVGVLLWILWPFTSVLFIETYPSIFLGLIFLWLVSVFMLLSFILVYDIKDC